MASIHLRLVMVGQSVAACSSPARTATQPRTRRSGDTVAAPVPDAHGQGVTT
jgi:hypothetical protein